MDFEESRSRGARLYRAYLLPVVSASLIFHFVEAPIRGAKDGSRSRGLLLIYALSLAGTVGVFVISETTGGLPNRFLEEVTKMMSFAEDHTTSSTECAYDEELGVLASSCVIGKTEDQPKWVIYGDSHAWAARTVFHEWLKRRGESGRFVFRNSCPPVMGVYLFGGQGTCHRFNVEVAQWVIETDELENVLLVSKWRQALESKLSTSPREMIRLPERIRLMKRQFSETVVRYASAGKRVHVWEPVPEADRVTDAGPRF